MISIHVKKFSACCSCALLGFIALFPACVYYLGTTMRVIYGYVFNTDIHSNNHTPYIRSNMFFTSWFSLIPPFNFLYVYART
ncbi:hypothetical protein ES319_D10G215700v1 [Gossypium barbadense]|uniref:Uncharacterized protein n=1 Tax=Gossypium barbadense TaxID=3634 RepID=A0A5J5PUA8_GOSBA|nr:hypothetical protein ES319_D10G215700v1 [Gossypium barbadense]